MTPAAPDGLSSSRGPHGPPESSSLAGLAPAAFCVYWGRKQVLVQIQWPSGLGAVIAIIVLILAVVFMAIGQMDLKVGILIALLAVARLT